MTTYAPDIEKAGRWVQHPQSVLTQWHSVKVQGHELNKVFQHIVDDDGQVQGWQFIGGRDWVIFYSKPVVR
jgi:hypothetical protein